jgi:hypothetical protein
MNGKSKGSIRSCLVEVDKKLFFASFLVLYFSHSLSLSRFLLFLLCLFYYVKNILVYISLRVFDLDWLLD